MAANNRQGKMINYINYRMRVIMNDGRHMVGQMMAFDKHMNLVLADCEEFRQVRRRVPNKTASDPSVLPTVVEEEKRTLGLVIIRGQQVMSTSVEGPPPQDPASRLGASASNAVPAAMSAGPGISKPIGRGAGPAAGAGLQGPAPGVGGPGPGLGGFGGFAPPGPPGFAGRGGPPAGYPPAPPGFSQPWGGPPGAPGGAPPPPGFQAGPPAPPGAPGGPPGRGYPPPPPGFGGR